MEREELIDAYLQQTLTLTEQKVFDNLCKDDPDFKNEITFIQDVSLISGLEDREELKKTLQNFEAKIINEHFENTSLLRFKKWLLIASLLLIGILSGIILWNPFTVHTDTLYDSNFEPYKNVITSVTRGESRKIDEADAFVSYENKEYVLAAMQFEKLFELKEEPYLLLYQGNALLANDNAKAAIPLLEKHVALKGRLSDRGKWYLALAYLKDHHKKKAKIVLKDIVRNKTFKNRAAATLLKKLK